ncbi:hypothetical protein [Aquibacillus albus]|uniref:Transposase n=1 Tax=Aquibacillus albus TaxID=1168171 RepID=A0ABS2N2S4_9BACI|nr:hypothetical protein [Aquibacillus albus]MBM7572363.1 hypothetical protein [Aquibacillus albus]
MKNHIKVNGKLLQTNKSFSQLKNSQKEWIAGELYKLYHNEMKKRRTTRKLKPDLRDFVISSLYDKIENRGIWIPYREVKKYVFSKTTKVVNSFKKQYPELSNEIEAEHTMKQKR